MPPAYYAHLAAFRARFYMEAISDSGSGTSPGGTESAQSKLTITSTASAIAYVRPLPIVKENVKRVMFFC